MAKAVEVFQDLNIDGPINGRSALRAALIDAAKAPWSVDLQRSAEVASSSGVDEDVLLFRRGPGNDFPAAGLTLWGTDTGYYVPNIVPMENGSLSHAQYNAVLSDFVANIASETAPRFGYALRVTKATQGMEDWVGSDAASLLQWFSEGANKSTGASHPADQRRWFQFIVSVHRSGNELSADRLGRWLREAEGWNEETSWDLAIDFEKAMALLKHYDHE